MSKNAIIPFPKGTTFKGREAVGFIACHGYDCIEYQMVRLDKNGVPYAKCDNTLTVRGCRKRGWEFDVRDCPPQSEQRLIEMADRIADMPLEHQQFLASAWNKTIEEMTDAVAQGSPEEEAPVLAETAGEPERDEPAESLGTSGSSEPDEPGSAGGSEEVEPAESGAGFFDDPELDDLYGTS